MNYIDSNKAAWEEAFEHRRPDWTENNHLRLKSDEFAFFRTDMKEMLKEMDFLGKRVSQFCCHDGRELLSLMDGGADSGVGFDIAENMISHAEETARKAGIKNCFFHACNILEIPERYHAQFDFILFTIGSIIWFEDLSQLFDKASKCLKNGGLLLINDFHPLINMLALPGDKNFDPNQLNRFVYSYFKREPWITNDGMGYMTPEYKSKTFTSYYHPMSAIVNALSENRIKTVKLKEYDYSDDIGLTGIYQGKGIPLSYILVAEKGG